MEPNKLDKIAEDVSELKSGQARMEVHVSEIKDDLKYHIKRTDLNEARLHRIEKAEQWVKGALWVIMGAGGLVITYLKWFR